MPPATDASGKLLIPNVPFYAMKRGQPGQCWQVSMQVVLDYYLKKHFSLEELDRHTGRSAHYWTWTPQAVIPLHDLGLHVRYFSNSELEPCTEGEAYIRRAFPNVAEKMLHHTNIPVLVDAAKRLMAYDIFEKKRVQWDEIETFLRQGYLVIVLYDLGLLYHLPDAGFQGHAGVVVGFDAEHVIIHESYALFAEPYKRVPKKDFIAAMQAEGTDHDVVVVYGPRAT